MGVKIILVVVGGDFGDFGFDDVLWAGEDRKQNSKDYCKHSQSDDGENGAFRTFEDFAVEFFGACDVGGFNASTRSVKTGTAVFVFWFYHNFILP